MKPWPAPLTLTSIVGSKHVPDFAASLAALGLSQVQLRRWIAALTGRQIHPTTTSRYVMGIRSTSPEMDALLAVIEKPELIEELRR